MKYFKSSPENAEYSLHVLQNKKIEKQDVLYIRVTSFDESAYNYFGHNVEELRTFTENALAVMSYTVDKDGYIFFPVIGKIKVEGLTIEEVTEKIKLILADYFNEPNVIVNYVNRNVTIVGEVRIPGTYYYSKSTLNIIQALSLAGDVTGFGNRKEIYLYRQIDDKLIKRRIDLSDDEIIGSEYFHIKTNDIIYVEPLMAKNFDTLRGEYGLILSFLTTLVLIFQVIRQI